MATPTNPIARLDVPREQVEQQIADDLKRQQQKASADKLRDLLSPERFRWLAAHRVKADPKERLEYRHLLHDEDPDSTVPAFRVDLIKKPAGGTA